MNKILFVCILLTFEYGCASKANLEFNLNTWVGNSVKGLIQHWGTPSDVNNLSNGSASYTWLFDDGIANSPIKGSVNAVAIYCKITVDVSKNEMIQSWQLEGNDCKV